MPRNTAGADVTPAIPWFNPPDTEVDVVKLSWERAAAWKLAGRVLGDARNGSRAIKNSAKEFSEIISSDISSANSYNSQEWKKACMALTYAASIAELWCEDVSAFQKKREKLISDYRTEAYAITSKVDSSGYYQPGSVWAVPKGPEAVRQMLADLLARYQKVGRERHQKLLDTAEKRAAMLDEGPEPKNLKLLVEAGILGWGAHNILGVDKDTPLPVSAEKAKELVKDLELFLTGGVEPDSRVTEALAVLAAVSDKARALQQAGGRGKLGEDELEFLETFYAELEKTTPGGLVHLAPWLAGGEGPGWSEQQNRDFTRAVGNGLLALSDEGIGGGQDSLPESVQRLANGLPSPHWSEGGTGSEKRIIGRHSHNWLMDAEDFAGLLAHTDPGLRGGTDFSANLTLGIGHHLDNTTQDVSPGTDKALSSLLDVTTRNVEANHRILTDAHEHPAVNSDDSRYKAAGLPDFTDNTKALLSLYTHEWEDEGKAVSGLTDWISEFKEGGDPEQVKMAAESTLALMTTLAGEEGNRPFHDTDKTSDSAYSLAATEINPELALGLAEVYMTFLDDLTLAAEENGYMSVGSVPENLLLHEADDMALFVDDDTKRSFLQLLVADEGSSARITEAVERQELKIIGAALDLPHSTAVDNAGSTAGTLRSMVHNAMIDEFESRTTDKKEARQQAADRWQTGFNITVAASNNLLGSIPRWGPAAAFGGEALLRLYEVPGKEQYLEDWDAKHQGGTRDLDQFVEPGSKREEFTKLQVLKVLVARGDIDMEALEERDLLMDNKAEGADPGEKVLPQSPSDLGNNRNGKMANLTELLEGKDQDPDKMTEEARETHERVKQLINTFSKYDELDEYKRRNQD